jgi:hypothetical protein
MDQERAPVKATYQGRALPPRRLGVFTPGHRHRCDDNELLAPRVAAWSSALFGLGVQNSLNPTVTSHPTTWLSCAASSYDVEHLSTIYLPTVRLATTPSSAG